MMREIIRIKLTPAYKQQALCIIDDTIKDVADKYDVELSETKIRKIRNLSLDQVNINVSQKTRSKTMWVFDVEDVIPIAVDKHEGSLPLQTVGLLGNQSQPTGVYSMRPNLTWTFVKEDLDNGLSREEFKEEVLKMLLEDFETAAFYGALSHVSELDIDE